MILVDDVHKRYTTKRGVGDWVLRGINLVIPKGRSVGLVGANGAGKSTLLRIIGGADYPTRGRVERRCRVSWPMGNGGLEGTLTGRQNAKFVCRIHGFQNELPERIERIKENIDIFDFELNEEEMKQISSLNMGYSGSRAKHFDVEFVEMCLAKKIHD